MDPIAFTVGSFSVRWYALAYIVGFGVVWLLLTYRIGKGEADHIFPISKSQFPISKQIPNHKYQIQNELQTTNQKLKTITLDFFLVAFFAALSGGRIGYVLFYDAPYFWTHPLAIFWPYDSAGQFIGLYGMSYHGALLGILAGSWIFLRARKIDFFRWADFVIPAVPLGYFFGRIGNFLNGELYGRVTGSPLGMYFAADPSALRHPSQLYEALLEGLLLFAILWKMRKRKLPDGALLAAYLMGYGFFRILAENFREPDPQIGLLGGYFTLGQALSFAMIIAGASILIFKKSEK